MKKLFFLVTSLLLGLHSYSQLTGSKSIPGDYATIAQAISALNAAGVGSGGVTFNVAAGHTETLGSPTAGTITTTTGSLSNPILFQRSGTGTNPMITAALLTSSTATDGIIKIAGCDYIVFDGIDLQENSGNTTNKTDWGYAILKASAINGSQNITITNCTITLNKTNTTSIAIYAGNHTAISTSSLTITTPDGTNSNLKFYGNTITNTNTGISVNGYNAPSPYSLYDQNNEIGLAGSNAISDFTGGKGIYAIYQNHLKIKNNQLTETASTGSVNLYGIQCGIAGGAVILISSNILTLKTGTGSGSPAIYGIACNSGSAVTNSKVTISGNTILNCTYGSTGSSGFYGIDLQSSPDSAIISSNSITGTVQPGTGTFAAIQVSGSPGKILIHSNVLSGNQKTGSSGEMSMIKSNGSKIHTYSNIIYNNAMPSVTSAGTSKLYGYYCDGAPVVENIHHNHIDTLLTNIGLVTGIRCSQGDSSNVFSNNVSHLSSASGLNNATGIKGIDISNNDQCLIYNNFITNLNTTSANGANQICGVYLGSSSVPGHSCGLFHNTIYLNATSSNLLFGSSALFWDNSNSNLSVKLVNNIIINKSTPNGAGLTVAYRISSQFDTNTYVSGSDRNDFYAGNPGQTRLIFTDGLFDKETISQYKAAVEPRDANSFTELPPFVDLPVPGIDFHIQTGIATQCESGGINISLPVAITTDYDGQARYPGPGYPNDPAHPAVAPDVGADEFGGIKLDLVPPAFSYTPLPNTASILNRILNVTITDDFSGMPVSGIGLPVLWWRKVVNNVPGTWTNVQGVSLGNNQYSFTFGSGVAFGNSVQYYMLAQDMASTPNVSTSAHPYVGEFTSNPPACSPVPNSGSVNQYEILEAVCGTFTVGTSGDFITIGEALESFDGKEVTCPITFFLTDEEYPDETFPILLTTPLGASATNTITLKPSPGVLPVISAYVPEALFIFTGADYFILDGSNASGGSTRNLTLENTYGSADASVIQVGYTSSGGAQHNVIKNCILKGGSQEAQNYGIFMVEGGHDDLTIRNNQFLFSSIGLLFQGNAGSPIDGGLITGNAFGDDDPAVSLGHKGIAMAYADGITVENNIIRNISYFDGSPAGISVGTEVLNTSILSNAITGVRHTGADGWGGRGIEISTENPASNLVIANNLISDISGDGYFDGSSAIIGIGISGSATGGVSLYYNSVNLFGEVSGNYQNNISASVYLGSQVSAITMKNNIFRNTITDITEDALAYAIYSDAPNTAFTEIDYNVYYAGGDEWITGYLEDTLRNLSQWQAATGQDVHSHMYEPSFVTDTDLHLTASNNSGIPVPAITTDYSGSVRDPSKPDAGAYESADSLPSMTWSGNVNGNWNDMGNWVETGSLDPVTTLPNPSIDIVIPGGISPVPTITVNATCRNLTIQSSGNLTVGAGISLDVNGNLILHVP